MDSQLEQRRWQQRLMGLEQVAASRRPLAIAITASKAAQLNYRYQRQRSRQMPPVPAKGGFPYYGR